MSSADRPNILLITTDQQRFDTIAALGNREIWTPHLDWLADDGITFTRCYSDAPVCMAARATIMTGCHGYTTGLTSNSHTLRPMAERPTLPGCLTAAGYQTRAVGKMHFEPMRANYGFEHMELPMDYYRQQHRKGGSLPKAHGVGENEMQPVVSTVHETESLTHWTVERSIDFLETRDDTRPFFLWTSFTKPHPPFDPPANYWALYQNREVSPPHYGDWSQTAEQAPQGFFKNTYILNNIQRYSPSQLADAKRAYYACITHVDYELGQLFARLREMKLLETTWIIFTSDHGEMLGDHHLGAKGIFFEGSAHVPMLVRPPGASWEPSSRAGETCDRLVQLADLMPTILNTCGVDAPAGVDGLDVLQPGGPDERPFFGMHAKDQFAVMKGQLKLVYTPIGGGELLFDLASDPYEQHNLRDDPAYAEPLARLRATLTENLTHFAPELIRDGKIVPDAGISGPQDLNRWPGFHSTVEPSDVLH
ncbi:MAG: sulfatase-like hydrolase/transferase [Opitutales bacterium]